jgi:hypothetical protein
MFHLIDFSFSALMQKRVAEKKAKVAAIKASHHKYVLDRCPRDYVLMQYFQDCLKQSLAHPLIFPLMLLGFLWYFMSRHALTLYYLH